MDVVESWSDSGDLKPSSRNSSASEGGAISSSSLFGVWISFDLGGPTP